MENVSFDDATVHYIICLLDDGKPHDEIVQLLVAKGHAYTQVQELVQETKKLRYARRRTTGLSLILGGAMLCFISCLLTVMGMFEGNSTAYGIVLYGVTGLGVMVIMVGFYYVF